MKGLGILYKKMKRYFLKIFVYINFDRIFEKKKFLLTTSVLLAVEGYFACQVKGVDVLDKKLKCYFRKKVFRKI